MYQWWVFVHLVGVFVFLTAHGVSVFVTFRLRSERDPRRITDLLALSGSSIRYFYIGLGLLMVGGIVAGFLGKWWSQGWIWGALIALVLTSLAMFGMARPYYRRVGFVARAMAGGSSAVSEEQLASILTSRRPISVATIGVVGLGVILYLMLFKPTLGFGGVTPVPVTSGSGGPVSASVHLSARSLTFSASSLAAPATKPFAIVFDNQDAGIPHNVAIYTNSSASTALFRGAIITGPSTVTYRVGAIPAGTYYFRCDVHPNMNGTLVVK